MSKITLGYTGNSLVRPYLQKTKEEEEEKAEAEEVALCIKHLP